MVSCGGTSNDEVIFVQFNSIFIQPISIQCKFDMFNVVKLITSQNQRITYKTHGDK